MSEPNINNNMNNMLGSQLTQLLAGVDKNKLEQVTKMVSNMSKDDLNNLMRMLSNNSNNSNLKKS